MNPAIAVNQLMRAAEDLIAILEAIPEADRLRLELYSIHAVNQAQEAIRYLRAEGGDD
jgi:hypothetical protein